ncbi:MAG: hypothetical protein IPI35_35390 [Deltaproteobacteria bacterium]|nr:hypothetical protein [Deltaproteobacteria bacterium]
MRFGLMMQFDDLQIYPFTRGDEVRGGTRYTMNETKVRIDYVYHAQSTPVQYRDAALTDPNLPPRSGGRRFGTSWRPRKKALEAAAAGAGAAGLGHLPARAPARPAGDPRHRPPAQGAINAPRRGFCSGIVAHGGVNPRAHPAPLLTSGSGPPPPRRRRCARARSPPDTIPAGPPPRPA